jgi:hypothetical protein
VVVVTASCERDATGRTDGRLIVLRLVTKVIVVVELVVVKAVTVLDGREVVVMEAVTVDDATVEVDSRVVVADADVVLDGPVESVEVSVVRLEAVVGRVEVVVIRSELVVRPELVVATATVRPVVMTVEPVAPVESVVVLSMAEISVEPEVVPSPGDVLVTAPAPLTDTSGTCCLPRTATVGSPFEPISQNRRPPTAARATTAAAAINRVLAISPARTPASVGAS